MRRSLLWGWGVVLGLGVLACASGKREAASLVTAVDRYRAADLGAKGALVGGILAASCTDAEVCAAKEACLAAARPTAEGAALKGEVEGALAALRDGKITQDQAAEAGLAQKLDESSRLLGEGHGKLAECDARITALRLKYGL